MHGKESINAAGISAEEILDVVRAEPALAWFLAQALWLAQPALEAFWPQEKIAAVAEFLESGEADSAAAPIRPAGEGGGEKT
jgi:hypothetical protein